MYLDRVCLTCQGPIPRKYPNGKYLPKNQKFCSHSCSAIHNNKNRKHTPETKHKMSVSNRLYNIQHPRIYQIKSFKFCPICNESFHNLNNKIYCSKKCYLADSNRKHRNGGCGGYREGSGYGKSGYYKGIYCASTYELCWVIYNLDHESEFSRFPGFLERDGLKYYPDFLIPNNTIIEIKGYHRSSVDEKTKLAQSFGYTVHVLYKSDIQHMIDYVKFTYITNDIVSLYDNYKPKFQYICSYCGCEFNCERKRKTSKVYCSQTCTGKAHWNCAVSSKG